MDLLHMWGWNRASYANDVYSSPHEVDLWKILSVFIHFVYVLQLVWWPLLLKRAVDICSLWLWCYICWYRLIILLCLRSNNFVRHVTFYSEIYFMHNVVFMAPVFMGPVFMTTVFMASVFIRVLHSFSEVFLWNILSL